MISELGEFVTLQDTRHFCYKQNPKRFWNLFLLWVKKITLGVKRDRWRYIVTYDVSNISHSVIYENKIYI